MKSNRKNSKLAAQITLAVFLAGIPQGALAGRSPAVAKPVNLRDDVVESPYEACKGVVIVSKSGYEKHKKEWQQWEQNCGQKVQLSVDAGFTNVDPLDGAKDSAQYLNFAGDVAEQALANLAKSRKFAECSERCFKGADSCSASMSDDGKAVSCSDRKKQILEGLKGQSRKARAELALSESASSLISVSASNIQSLRPEQMINKDLRDFEMGIPNAVGRNELTSRELAAARATIEKERKQVENAAAELVKKGKLSKQNVGTYIATERANKRDEHRVNYLRVVYQEAPILGVIDRPSKFESGEPVWDDKVLATAFGQLVENADKTKEKISADIKRGSLEFTRVNGEAFARWFYSSLPMTTEQNDLLYYMGLTHQVEEVLAKDKGRCGVATAMAQRLGARGWQNMGAVLLATGGVMVGVGKKAALGAADTASAISGAKAVALTGMAMTGPFLIESYKHYETTKEEAATKSGLGGEKEGTALHTAEDIAAAKTGLELNALFGVATPGLGAATVAGVNSAKRFLAGAATRGALKEQGVSDDLAKQVAKLASSKDAKVKAAAQKQIDEFLAKSKAAEQKLLGEQAGNPDFDKLVDGMTAKGVVSSAKKDDAAKSVNLIEDLAKSANALANREERRAYLSRATELLGKYSPAKTATPAQKQEAMRAIAEYSHLGVKDEKHVAKVLSEWPEDSLKGLRLSLKSARVELKGAPATEAQLETAHREALAKLKYNNSYKQLDDAKRAEVDQMHTCAVGGGKARASVDPITGLTVASASSCFGEPASSGI